MSSMECDNERSTFLHYFQQLEFGEKSEDVLTKAQCLRAQLAELQSQVLLKRLDPDTGSHLMNKIHQRYIDVVDTETGLNNYADPILALCDGERNESSEWKSGLSLESIEKLDCVQQLKRNCEKHKVFTDEVEEALKSMSKGKSPAAQTPVFRPCFKKENRPPPTQNKNLQNVPKQELKDEELQNEKPIFMNKANLFQGSGKRNKYQKFPKRKKPPEEDIDDLDDDLDLAPPKMNSFKTAAEQLHLNNQKKYNRNQNNNQQGSSSMAYGTGKKSLGTRRGISSKFIPPLADRDSDDGGSTGSMYQTSRPKQTNRQDSNEPCDERLKNIEPKMIELIQNEIMDNSAPILWDDIAGLEFAKKTIKEIVIWPMLRPDIFTGLRGPPKGLLLFGPPGTGKTLIGKCIASQSKSTFFSISASSLTSKWVGEGEKMVRALFAVARVHQPAVVFIDEIDSLLTQRTDGENEASRRIKTEFLVQLDGAATGSEDRILVVGATNRPQEIDEAARRRFVKRLYIPLPEYEARRQIIVNLMSTQANNLREEEIDKICRTAEGYSGADMANLCREAALGPIRSISFNEIEHIAASQVRPIYFGDFKEALTNVRASVSTKDLDLYIEWNNTYGCGGR